LNKKKLFIYPQARQHDHDSVDKYVNTVPMSRMGIDKHFVLSTAKEADYFYMGQFNNDRGDLARLRPEHFSHMPGNETRHICDIEGEGGFEASNRSPIPEWLHNSVVTTMGPLKTYSNIECLFTRPTFSHLLMDIITGEDEIFEFPSEVSFGFRGFLNHRIRAMMVHSLHNSDFKKELHINRVWSGTSEAGSKNQLDYINTMENNLISLCPRGSGIDSVRLVETCYYRRVPVLISDNDYYLVGEDTKNLDFVFRIVGNDLTPERLRVKLDEIYRTPMRELQDRADAARKYFDTTIRDYFSDPTRYFLEWLAGKQQTLLVGDKND